MKKRCAKTMNKGNRKKTFCKSREVSSVTGRRTMRMNVDVDKFVGELMEFHN